MFRNHLLGRLENTNTPDLIPHAGWNCRKPFDEQLTSGEASVPFGRWAAEIKRLCCWEAVTLGQQSLTVLYAHK